MNECRLPNRHSRLSSLIGLQHWSTRRRWGWVELTVSEQLGGSEKHKLTNSGYAPSLRPSDKFKLEEKKFYPPHLSN